MAGVAPSSDRRHDAGPEVLSTHPPLVGRDPELAVLQRFLTDGQPGGVLLTGPLGVGRTRLLREAVRISRDLGRRTVLITGTGPDVPLGPLAHAVPPVPGEPDRFVLLQHALAALRGDRPVIAVDDAHRLDDLTRSVLEQLLLAGDATVVATERSDRAPVDRLRTLGDDVRPIAVRPLAEADTDRLLHGMLGGDVEARTAQRLRELAQGTPLFLCELVRAGHESGRLTRRAGPWRWDGPMEPPPRLGSFVLAGLAPDEWAALERLVAGGPGAGPGGAGELVRRELVRTDRAGRAAVPPFVAAVVAGAGRAGPDVPAAREPGDRPDPVAAATAANRELDHARAERIARQALADDRDGIAHLELIESLRWQDRGAELPPLLAEAGRRARTGDGPARIAMTRALLARRAGEPALAAAEEALAGEPSADGMDGSGPGGPVAPAGLASSAAPGDRISPGERPGPGEPVGSRDALAAEVAVLEAAARLDGVALARAASSQVGQPAGRPGPVPGDPGPGTGADPDPGDAPARSEPATVGQDLPGGRWAALAAAARAGRLAAAGRPAEALDTVAGVRSAPDPDGRAESALTGLLLVDAELSALRVAGRPEDLRRAAEDAHRHNLAAPGWAGDAWIAWHRGRAALARGDLDAAGRNLAEARAGTADRDPLGLATDCSATLALVHVLTGDRDRARALIDGLPGRVPPAAAAAVTRARAWLQAADNSGAAPVRALLAGARSAAARGDLVTEVVLLHDVARLGRPDRVVDRLADRAARGRSPLLQLFAAHASAVARAGPGAGGRLDRVAADLALAGARLEAADVAAAAAAAHHRAGERRRSAASAARATELAGGCGARTPALDRLVRPRLTGREREIAELAAEGASNAEVARRLVLSVRTVETHLAHAYAKLGIEGRTGLIAALPAPDRPD
ncbi:LuxR C-terminal-related transcriptional regulator [Pseudonocardia sp. NPDC046786]|uniref:helix-turn-helix transcriptional regulator n=1 Tax=Pseudonocardia sp. NPDC046786 TaxID=3155471 RepID=UPI0033F40566